MYFLPSSTPSFNYSNLKSTFPLYHLRLLGILLLLASLSSCQEESTDQLVLLSKIKDTAKLSTTKVTISKIVVGYDEKSGFLVDLNLKKAVSWDKTIIVHTEAVLEAGIDLKKLNSDSIQVDGQQITLNLPAVEVFYLDYPVEKFELDENYSKGIGKGWPTPMDLDQIFQKAEISIREAVNYMGIRQETETRTRFFLESLLKLSGYEEIIINFARKDPLLFTPVSSDLYYQQNKEDGKDKKKENTPS